MSTTDAGPAFAVRFAVAGGALEVIGLIVVAGAALRMTNAAWVARG